MRTPGLDRLHEVQREGASLFHGARGLGKVDRLYPERELVSLDPDCVRGTWVPNAGLLRPVPVVRQVFASCVVAAFGAILQRAGAMSIRAEEFSDGMVALTFGENSENEGALTEALHSVAGLADGDPVAEYQINVVRRSAFPSGGGTYALPGHHVSFGPVAVVNQVPLTAGDIRWLARLLGRKLFSMEQASIAQADLFTGPFADGGDLQFDPASGERTVNRRPTQRDRALAMGLHHVRVQRWLETARAQGTSVTDLPFRSGAFDRAVSFIIQNSDRRLTLSEIAEGTDLSPAQLRRLFLETAGCSPVALAAEHRLGLAEKMLRETNLSIAEISERCGFAEQASLCRALRRRQGMPPSAFRRAVFALSFGHRGKVAPPWVKTERGAI